MFYLLIALAAILVYNFIGMIICIFVKDNEDFTFAWTLGVFFLILTPFVHLINLILQKMKHHKYKSIITDYNSDSGDKKYCSCEYADDFCWHGYSIVKRYAEKEEYSQYSQVSPEETVTVLHNCRRCQYNDSKICSIDKPLCKCDESGCVTEFERFVPKTKAKKLIRKFSK